MPAIVPALAVTILATLAAEPAWAYIGPGAGLSMLAAFWALLMAIFASIGFLVFQPLWRRMRGKRSADVVGSQEAPPGPGQG
jgi:TRAP-type C4-dicarboxylate transport system permease small subunit